MTEIELQIQKEVIQTLDAQLSPETSYVCFINKLEEYINHLIRTDFQKLVFLLYKIDTNENHLKQLLNDNKEKNSASFIAQMIIDRQLQKVNSRQQFTNMSGISEEEKW